MSNLGSALSSHTPDGLLGLYAIHDIRGDVYLSLFASFNENTAKSHFRDLIFTRGIPLEQARQYYRDFRLVHLAFWDHHTGVIDAFKLPIAICLLDELLPSVTDEEFRANHSDEVERVVESFTTQMKEAGLIDE